MYTIGQVAAMFHMPISTLRYYDRQGLLPNLPRSGGARKFGAEQLEALRVIACLKKSGLEIREIKQFMDWCAAGAETYPQRKVLFQRQKARVEVEIGRLQQTLDMLDFKCWYYDRAIQDGNETQLQAMLPDCLPPEIQTLYNRAHAALPAQEE